MIFKNSIDHFAEIKCNIIIYFGKNVHKKQYNQEVTKY
jgi:hypothetical protein